MRTSRTLIAALVVLAFACATYAGMAEGPRCAECGMKVDLQSRYSAHAVTKDGRTIYFCDIGDMIYHILVKKKADVSEIYVKDHKTGETIDARAAFYSSSGEFSTPMGWGVAAFKNEADARAKGRNVKDFGQAVSVLDR